jgi:glycogen operon protein
MLLMGDEVRRTQFGNNNAYCQDNEGSWFDRAGIESHRNILRFITLLNARRALRDEEHERRRLTLNELVREAQKAWHGVKLISRTAATIPTAWHPRRRWVGRPRASI